MIYIIVGFIYVSQYNYETIVIVTIFNVQTICENITKSNECRKNNLLLKHGHNIMAQFCLFSFANPVVFRRKV